VSIQSNNSGCYLEVTPLHKVKVYQPSIIRMKKFKCTKQICKAVIDRARSHASNICRQWQWWRPRNMARLIWDSKERMPAASMVCHACKLSY